jgi:hypothetical protein
MGPKKENEMKKSRELIHIILQLKQGKSWSISIRGNVQHDSRQWYVPIEEGTRNLFFWIRTKMISYYYHMHYSLLPQGDGRLSSSDLLLRVIFFISLPKFTPFNFYENPFFFIFFKSLQHSPFSMKHCTINVLKSIWTQRIDLGLG